MAKSDLDFGPALTSWGYLQEPKDHLTFGSNSVATPGWTGSSRLDIGLSQVPEPVSGGYGHTAEGGAHPHPLSPQDLIFISDDGHVFSDVKGPSFAKAGPAGGTTATPEWFTPVPYTSGSAGAYNIRIEFKGLWTQQLEEDFEAAAKMISGYIVGDLPDVRINGKVIDDVVITAELKSIDGVGNILGQAGPTALRPAGLLPSSYLPVLASMQFDSADAQSFDKQGLWDDIVTHEMLHSLGFGSIWSYKGLSDGSFFKGAEAREAYRVYAKADTLVDVPLETSGGTGTAGSHWSEEVFKTELMTGYIGYTDKADPLHPDMHNSISSMTWASMADLGYKLSSYVPHDMWAA